jgi:uncharacterized OB-fold protein
VSGAPLARCRACGHVVFPYRPLCPRCGARDWRKEIATVGVVEAVTRRTPRLKRRQTPLGNWVEQAEVYIASVRTEQGPLVTCRCSETTRVGDVVEISTDANVNVARDGQLSEARTVAPADRGPTSTS